MYIELDVDLVVDIIGSFIDKRSLDFGEICDDLASKGVEVDQERIANALVYLVNRDTLDKAEDGVYSLELGSAICPHCNAELDLEIAQESDGDGVLPGDKVLEYHLSQEGIECFGSASLPF